MSLSGQTEQKSATPKIANYSAVFSRDEMNLAEFPLTVLSTRTDPSLKTIEFQDTIKGKNGDLVNRNWIITGADKFGLPTSSDDEVLLGLLKLTVDDGMRRRKIHFTRYELLRALRWTTEGRNYTRLQKALDRLSGVRIKATNAFFDNELKSHSTKNFGLIDAYEINSSRETQSAIGGGRPSYFIWSDVIFKSFQVGFIKKLNLDFYLDLKSAVSKRLYRYLDKHFWYRSQIRTNLFVLAHEKIGISRNYRYASSLKQQLDPAFEELIQSGFLESVHYEGKGRDTTVVVRNNSKEVVKKIEQKEKVEILKTENGSLREQVIDKLCDRGIMPHQAQKLLEAKTEEELNRIEEIISYFDTLIAGKSKLISKSPVGFLYRAVERAENFILPEKKPLSKKVQQKSFENDSAKPSNKDAEYLTFRKKQLDSVRAEVSPNILQSIEKEVSKALEKLRPLISAQRFSEAITHGIDEKLAKLYKIPDFEEWGRNN